MPFKFLFSGLSFLAAGLASSAELASFQYDKLPAQDLFNYIKNEKFVIPEKSFLLKETTVHSVYNRYGLSDISSYAEARSLIDLAKSGDAKAQFELYLNYKSSDNEFFERDKGEAKKWLIASDGNGYFWAQIENFNIYDTSSKVANYSSTITDEMKGAYHFMMYAFKRPYEKGGDRVDNVKDNNDRECISVETYMPDELRRQYDLTKEGDPVYAFDEDLNIRSMGSYTYSISGGELFRIITLSSFPSYKTKSVRVHLAGDFSISKLNQDRLFLNNVIRKDRNEHLILAAKYSPKYYSYNYAKLLLDNSKGTEQNELAIKVFKDGAIAGDPRCILALGIIYHTNIFTERDLEAAYLYYMQYLCMNRTIFPWGTKYQSILNKWVEEYTPVIRSALFEKFIDKERIYDDGLNQRANYLYKLISNSKSRYNRQNNSPAVGFNIIDINHVLDVVLIQNESNTFFHSQRVLNELASNGFDTSYAVNSSIEGFKAAGFSEDSLCYNNAIDEIRKKLSSVAKTLKAKKDAKLRAAELTRISSLRRARIQEAERLKEQEKLERLQLEEKRAKIRDLAFAFASKIVAPVIVILFLVRRWKKHRRLSTKIFDIPKEYFTKAAIEFSSNERNKETLLKAEVLTSGNESLTKLKYIELRSAELYKEENKSSHQ
jgi:TPR repeat protein